MSTSDAGAAELQQLRTAPPAHRTPRAARTATARSQHDETVDERDQPENPNSDATPSGQVRHRSTIRKEGPHRVIIFGADGIRRQEAAKACRPRFTTSLFFKLPKNQKVGVKLQPESDCCHSSFPDPQRVDTEDTCRQVNQGASPAETPAETASDLLLKIVTRTEEVITTGCNEPETTRDVNINHPLSNGDSGPHDYHSLHILPHVTHPKSTCSGLEETKKDIKVHTKVENQNNLGLSNAAVTMLSSTMVTVLAPHWTGRMRRTKRFEGIGDSEALGNFQVMASTATNHAPSQHGVERAVTERSQARQRDPFLVTRSNTVEWSTKSDLARLDYESKRKINQPVSLDVNSERMDNRKLDKGALSPVAPNVSSMSLDPNEQRRNPQTGNQGVHSALSSKPTTSSLLLSLRRMNSSGMSSTAASGLSDENHTARDQQGNMHTPHLSQSILNNNEKDRTKSVLSPQLTSYRTAETGPILPPSSSNRREGNMSESRFFSNSPTNKDTEVTPFTQQPQTCSKPVFLSRGESVMQQNCRDSNKNTNIYPPVSSPRHSPYDTSALLKSHTLPRRTTLTSTSWWKQVTQEGSSPVTHNVTPSINDQLNTPLFSPCSDRSNLVMPVPSDNNRLRSQISLNRDNSNTADTVFIGNTNIIKETQGGTHIKERNARDLPEQKLDKQLFGSSLNNREPQKSRNVEDVLSTPKISRDTPHKTLTHPTNLSKVSLSNANVSESPPTFQNLKSSVKPTETNSKYMSDHCSSKTCITPISLHNNYSGITKQSLSTTSLNSQSAHFKTSTTPLGFERSYASIPKNCPPKTLTSLITTGSAFSKTKYTTVPIPAFIASMPGSYPPSTTVQSPSLLSPPVTPAVTSSPTTITHSSPLTPPATPILKSPSCLKNSSSKEGTVFSSSPETDPKKLGVEAKKVRRVTWEDSVDSQPITEKKPDPPDVPTGPLSSTRSPSGRTPSIFNFLRSSSPTSNTTPPPHKISSIEVAKGSKYRSLSSDSADFRELDQSKQECSGRMNTDHVIQDLGKNRQERPLSVEYGTVKCHPSTSFSLPADFSSGYKLRYSSPPYSTLMSSRSAQGESLTKLPRSPLYPQASQSTYTPELSSHADPSLAKTIATSKPPLSQISSPQTVSLPLQNKTATQENSKCEVSETDALKSHTNNGNQDNHQIGQVLLNRVDISSACPQNPSSTCVTETLVYSIKSQVNTARTAPQNSTPKPVQHTANAEVSLENSLSQQPHTSQSKEVSGKSQSHSDHSSSGSSSTGSQSQGEESRNKTMKESMLSKSRFFSVESNNEQSPKRSRFALKKSVSTPSFSLSRSDSERSNKTNNKMDQVLNKLRQTFSTRRSEDDPSFPWKWKRASQTPSVSGSSDISSVSDATVDRTKTLEEGGSMLKDSVKGTEDTNRWTQNRYTIIPPPAVTGDGFSAWSEKSPPETGQDEKSAFEGQTLSATQVHLKAHSPTIHQLDFFKDNKTDYKPTSQSPTCRDPSPNLNPNQSDGYATQFKKSTSSPRSPFSPFSSLTPVSLTPVSPFSSPDVTDDSVFYSPKLQRRRESPSCDAGEGISLGSSRSRASTGPPSPDIGQDKDHLASSYADLKYGIVPGRSFSVSSVLSSRPSGPGRISTGSRFMSVGDLSKPSLTCSGNGKDLDRWSFPAGLPQSEYGVSYYSGDPGKMRSRSLPRSFSSCLSNWSSGVNNSPPRVATASKPAHHWGANVNICDFEWDVDGPPTPPPTPPLSPVSRRISTPPSISSPTFPSPPGAPQSVESQASRGRLPSRGYVSSLSTFEESSDSSSDTTTDDEYYLETGDGEEKETEL
ncbi:mucin-2 [Solea solea]|uniref:mucin-2 n=1 Tax=Solea solea TaxID=90069 RepID=UPI00272BDC21|nr:mucin-2 [Solea solea]